MSKHFMKFTHQTLINTHGNTPVTKSLIQSEPYLISFLTA
jgi:hypothetical protein